MMRAAPSKALRLGKKAQDEVAQLTAGQRRCRKKVPASRMSEASEDGEALPSEPQVEPAAVAVDDRSEGPGDVPTGPLADEAAVATTTETEPVADPPETTDASHEQETSPEQLRPAEELEPQETEVPREPQEPQEPPEAVSTAIEETAPPPEAAEPPEPPEPPEPAASPEEATEEAEGTEYSKAQELPFLPSDAAEAGKKALAPHWSQRGGKWQTRGSRLSSDEEGELDDDEEAQRRKIERAQRAAERRAKSGKLKDAVARFQSDEESHGPAGPRLSPRSATLFRLAGELQTAPASDAPTLLGILQELERLPATVELLRQTQLGVITQPFKDHGDPEVRALAKRLRRTWKDLIATAAGEVGWDFCGDGAQGCRLLSSLSSLGLAFSSIRYPHVRVAELMPCWRKLRVLMLQV
ncbi:zmpB [Symbiodinium sp. CCMP2592]|nr:zmpB [Symbiodinium sp. CCMP2592]